MAPSQPLHQASLGITFTCAFLPDATTFIAGYSDGQLALHAPQLPTFSEDDEHSLPIGTVRTPSRQFSWEAHAKAVYCAKVLDIGTKTFIISGGDSTISVWDYSDVTECSQKHVSGDVTATITARTQIPITAQGDRPVSGLPPETNALAWLGQSNSFAAAHGDGQVAIYSMETGQRTASVAGHQGTAMSVVATKTNTIISGGDDCVVRMWDVRSQKCVRSFLPFTGETTASGTMKASGGLPMVNCLDVDPGDTWMVCGGMCNYLTLWHLSSATLIAALPTAANVQCVMFEDSQIVSGGNEGYVSFWSHNGKLVARTPTECASVYALASNTACSTPVPMPKSLLVGGLGPTLDVFGDFNRKVATVA
eukprot:EG_transcript_13815